MFGIAEMICAVVLLPMPPSPSSETARRWGETIDKVWFTRRPEWAEMAIAILKGESMRPDRAWWRSSSKLRDGSWLLAHYDANADGSVSQEELPLGDREFDRLDVDADGAVTPKDVDAAGPSRSSPGGLWFRALDADSNGRVTRNELDSFFDKADQDKLGFLTPDDLNEALRDPDDAPRKAKQDDDDGMPPPSAMLYMLFSGQLGSLTQGPKAGDAAPEFRLPTLDGKSEIALSSSRRKKPVVLVFGSFT